MSPLLVIAIVLLVIVVGLTWLQRRAQVEPRGAVGKERSPSPPPERTGAAQGTETDIRTDPVLGVIGFNDGIWMTETDLDLGGSLVLVEIHGTIDGPTDADHQIVKAALARPDLEARARTLVLHELARLGTDATDLAIYELAVGPDDDGALHGYLWFEVTEFLGEIGVKSSDLWQTLTLEVVA